MKSLRQLKEFDKKIYEAYKILEECSLCPNNCRVNRTENQRGVCKTGINPVISSYNPHYGEEPPISGIYGSGTIFFTHCTMKCIFCQNYPISQLGNGTEISIEKLADIMLYLQQKKCHNINLVTPTHIVPQFLKALRIAISKGFKLPIVYNTSGYESVETLKLLEGIIDIYLPDIKYSDDEYAFKYSGIKNYVSINRAAIKEMFRQVGNLKTDKDGIAYKGMIIRHLVLPNNISGTKEMFNFLKEEVSTSVTISLMSQYFPAYKAVNDKKLRNRITKEEYQELIDYALKLGFENILIQTL